MLAHIRHIQKGLLIVVTTIIVIAFAFLYSDFDFVRGTLGKSNCFLEVDGTCYEYKEAAKLANSFQVATETGMRDFAINLFGPRRLDSDRTDFTLGLLILRNEARRMGIQPTAEEIQKAVAESPIWQNVPEWVDKKRAIQESLARYGFTEADYQDLVSDYLSWKKLREIVNAGIQPVPGEVELEYKQRYQRYTAQAIHFDRADYAGKVEITDEDIQKYYDDNKETEGNLQTELERGFEMVRFRPGVLGDEATNEDKANARNNFRRWINQTYSEMTVEGADFKKVAESKINVVSLDQIEIKTIEPFTAGEPPEFLAEETELIRELFSSQLQKGGITAPLEMKDGSYSVFRLSEVVEPRPLSLDEARDQIRKALEIRKSNQMANDAASEARQKILDALKAGKSLDDAAKEAGAESVDLPNFSLEEPPPEIEDASFIANAASRLEPGELSPVITKGRGDGYLLVHVEKIELYEDSSEESRKNIIEYSLGLESDYKVFDAWFNQRKKASGAVRRTEIPL